MRYLVRVKATNVIINYVVRADDEFSAIETAKNRNDIKFIGKEVWEVFEATGFSPIVPSDQFLVDIDREKMDDDEWYERFGRD